MLGAQAGRTHCYTVTTHLCVTVSAVLEHNLLLSSVWKVSHISVAVFDQCLIQHKFDKYLSH